MKKETKKLIAAGIVMALSCGAWGSVSAAGNGVISAGEHTGESFVWKNVNEPYAVDTDSVGESRTISITTKTIDIESTSNKNQNVWVADAYNGNELILGDSETKSITLKGDNSYKGLKGQVIGLMSNGQGSTVTVTAKDLDISVSGERAIAINVGNNTQYDGVTQPIPSDAAKMTINADRIHISSNDTGLGIFSNGQLTMNGDVTIDAPTDALGVRGFSTTNINAGGKHKTVINGDINFGTPNEEGGNGHNSGNKIDATLNINFAGEGSQWTGRAYQEFGKTTSIELSDAPTYYGNATGLTLNFSDGAQWNVTGDSFANHVVAENGAAVNVTKDANKVNIDTIKLADSTVNLQGSKQNVKVNTYEGNGTVTTASLQNKLTIGDKAEGAKLKVEGSGEIGDKILAGKATLEDLAATAKVGDKTASDEVETQDGIIAGKMFAKVTDGKIDASTVKRAIQQHNQAVSSMANLSLMTWRQENNDMNKRLGEVRASEGNQGIWARMARGQSKYGQQGIKNQYNYYQLGYDSKISDDWIVGGAFTYTDGDSSYTNGSGTNKHTGFAVYGSNLRDDGSFIDLIAKYAHMKNDFDVNGGVGSGDYSTNGLSFSAEYGKRFHQESYWIEPQAELTYGRVSSADFMTKNGASVHQDSMDSLVGRLGFSLGKDIKQGNVYVRASYLYDFQGDTSVTMSKNGAATSFKTDLGGGWWEFGVGTNLDLGHDTHFYLDVETTAGGDVDTPWQWNAGVRYSF
ncbi:autotransporter outer membrane beta-barrel domain-containing protein [Dialister sp. i34-0019-2H8]|uniref:autotransporter outer membrane beta-barrel domain-containing protein n=1 Tax=Dialister sp. i34-0019-2H8 TaxID=3141190 RepID=UPI0034A793A3